MFGNSPKICFVCGQEAKKEKKIKAGILCKGCFKLIDNYVFDNQNLALKALGMPRDGAINKMSADEVKNNIAEYKRNHPTILERMEMYEAEQTKRSEEAYLQKKNSQTEYHEIKMTCSACGHVHFFDASDIRNKEYHDIMTGFNFNNSKGVLHEMLAKEFDRCPKCGSRAVSVESVVNTIQ